VALATRLEPAIRRGANLSAIVSEYLDLVDHVAERIPLPAIRALHLPPDTATGKNAEFCALELADGSVGLSYLWLGYDRAHLRDLLARTAPTNLDVRSLSRWYGDGEPARRALGFAALNAISQHLFARAGFAPDTATSSVSLLEPAEGDHVGMIGLFPPLVNRILATGARLTVAEMNPRLVRDDGRYRVTLDGRELSACNKVISTSTVLLNDTIDDVLASCRNARYFGIIGPGAGCLPDPLFARGVSTVGGARVVAREDLIASVTSGQRWGNGVEKYCVRPDGYPGAEALLARAAARGAPERTPA
jgi:uncharacterized protein (DUF4213/DUF364 family)